MLETTTFKEPPPAWKIEIASAVCPFSTSMFGLLRIRPSSDELGTITHGAGHAALRMLMFTKSWPVMVGLSWMSKSAVPLFDEIAIASLLFVIVDPEISTSIVAVSKLSTDDPAAEVVVRGDVR